MEAINNCFVDKWLLDIIHTGADKALTKEKSNLSSNDSYLVNFLMKFVELDMLDLLCNCNNEISKHSNDEIFHTIVLTLY